MRTGWIAGAALAFTASPGSAQDWSVDAGMAATVLPDHLGSRGNTVRVLPLVDAKYGTRLTASVDDGLRWVAFDLGKLKLGPIAEFRQQDRSSHQMHFAHDGDAIELGGFATLETPIATIEARVRRAVTGYRGLSADLAIDTGAEIRPGTSLGLELRTAWADHRFVASRFGPDPSDIGVFDASRRSDRDYVTVGVQFAGTQRIMHGIELVAVASEDRILSSIASPQIETRNVRQATLGLRLHFGN